MNTKCPIIVESAVTTDKARKQTGFAIFEAIRVEGHIALVLDRTQDEHGDSMALYRPPAASLKAKARSGIGEAYTHTGPPVHIYDQMKAPVGQRTFAVRKGT